ncbi:F-box/FBD/LRR-repeat protein At1g13570-like [Diospyros lotus]|uniref:F-box/FBD/LRR-repeat protein At1g13570-like n=1 Tax=Diospyros lotus TaxID=55363 RepID=UPI00224D014B|nr:F-box/FBD/LRR-repeat protein At1g13570-like [Diospyros lotus]
MRVYWKKEVSSVESGKPKLSPAEGDDDSQLIFADGLPKRLPTDLSHLKILELHLEYVNDVSTILCFLRSSPNLEKIAIGLPIDLTKDDETVIKRFEVEGWSDICLNQLREVELRDAYCTRFELEFIKLILAKSPVLEKMVIESTDLMDTDDLGFLMEVTQFRRLSPLAQVYYYSR